MKHFENADRQTDRQKRQYGRENDKPRDKTRRQAIRVAISWDCWISLIRSESGIVCCQGICRWTLGMCWVCRHVLWRRATITT